MRLAAKTMGKKAVRIADSIVNLAVLVIILLLIAFACYAMWDSHQVYQAADGRQYEVYKPTAGDAVTFEEMRTINPEVFGWLAVYGTHIDYPVVQSTDNTKYVNTNAYGEYSLSGAIFLDSNNSNDFTDFNSILYGHHMEKQAMFGELDRFSRKSFFDSHQYGSLFYGGREHGLEFFAFLHTDGYNGAVYSPNVQDGEAQQAYLALLLKEASQIRDIGVTIQDRIVLLSTCSSETTNGRDILVARITDTVYDDVFKENETDNTGILKTVDPQSCFLTRLPQWVWVLAIVIIIILTGIVIYYICKKRRHLAQKDDTKNIYEE